MNGNATFTLQSIKVDEAVKMKLHNSMDNFGDWLALLPRGEPFARCSMSSLLLLLQSCRASPEQEPGPSGCPATTSFTQRTRSAWYICDALYKSCASLQAM